MSVRALLLDVDGTVVQDGALIPGVAEALARVGARGVALRFLTNTTSRPRSALVSELASLGLRVAVERLFTPARAAAQLLSRERLSRPHLLVADALREDLPGLESVDEDAEAIVIGDLGAGFTYERLDHAFRLALEGAELIALSKNRYFRSGGRLVLDQGPFVAALEYATGREAVVVGKPSPEFFATALADAGAAPGEALVVGDDLEGDVGGAQSAGIRGVLVKTGKFRAGLTIDTSIVPDAVLGSLAEIETLLA